MEQTILCTKTDPPLDGQWDAQPWRHAPLIAIANFHPRSSAHHPHVQAKMLHTGRTIHVLFRVQDRFVRAACTAHGQQVCKDSCVECFLEPPGGRGYFNFETNCGGTMLVWYIQDATPVPGGLRRSTDISADAASAVGVFHSLPQQIPIEIDAPTEWRLQLAIPITLLERYAGPIGDLHGQRWRANLFKCADHTSHPHWASWNPTGEVLNFHQPAHFGSLLFQEGQGL